MMTITQKHRLRTELALAKYDGMSDAEVLAALNVRDIPLLKPIKKADIRKYLRVTGAWLQLKRSSSDAAELAMDSITEDGVYETSHPLVLTKLTEVLNGVANDEAVPAFTETGVGVILSWGDALITRAEELGLGQVRIGHIAGSRADQ
jgi:hypothetical protein